MKWLIKNVLSKQNFKYMNIDVFLKEIILWIESFVICVIILIILILHWSLLVMMLLLLMMMMGILIFAATVHQITKFFVIQLPIWNVEPDKKYWWYSQGAYYWALSPRIFCVWTNQRSVFRSRDMLVRTNKLLLIPGLYLTNN